MRMTLRLLTLLAALCVASLYAHAQTITTCGLYVRTFDCTKQNDAISNLGYTCTSFARFCHCCITTTPPVAAGSIAPGTIVINGAAGIFNSGSSSQALTLSAAASTTATVFQWQYSVDNTNWVNTVDSGTILTGSTTNTLTVGSSDTCPGADAVANGVGTAPPGAPTTSSYLQSGFYRVLYSGGGFNSPTPTASVYVGDNTNPQISVQPRSYFFAGNAPPATVTFRVNVATSSATAVNGWTVKWYDTTNTELVHDGTNIIIATTGVDSTLTLAPSNNLQVYAKYFDSGSTLVLTSCGGIIVF